MCIQWQRESNPLLLWFRHGWQCGYSEFYKWIHIHSCRRRHFMELTAKKDLRYKGFQESHLFTLPYYGSWIPIASSNLTLWHSNCHMFDKELYISYTDKAHRYPIPLHSWCDWGWLDSARKDWDESESGRLSYKISSQDTSSALPSANGSHEDPLYGRFSG